MRSSSVAIIAALFLAQMAATFESAMLFAALPTLIGDFGDPITAGWLVTIHLLVSAVACVVAGRLGDLYGRKRVMLILLAASAVGSVASALTTSFAIVLAGRALQGVATAVIPLNIGILRESLPEERVPVAVGLMTTASGAGVATGLVLGGAIIDHFNWHWLFAASAVLLAISLAAVGALVPARPGLPARAPIDWVEGLLPAPAIAAVMLGISMSKGLGWSDPKVWGLVAAGVAIAALWARRSLRSEEPFIELRLLADRNVAVANLALVLLAFGTMQSVFVFSTYMQAPTWTLAGLGFTATLAGLVKLPSNFLSFFAGPLSGWLTQKRGSRVPLLLGGALATTGWVVAMALPSGLVQMVLLLCLVSFGTTILHTAIPNVIVASVPQERTSEAIGTMSLIQGMAAAIGGQLIAVLLATNTVTAPGGGAAFPSAEGFRLTMGWIAALSLGAGACALLLRGRSKQLKQVPATG
jgi:MFS family permease